MRVPLLVVSPWSTGGWVCSETFDHTSLIRFIEARFGVDEPNITPWRRAVCGDLTSAFDFESTSDHVPGAAASVAAYKPTEGGPAELPPDAAGGRIGADPGAGGAAVAPARLPLPRRLRRRPRQAQPRRHEPGRLGVGLQARSLTVAGAPYSYTIGAGDELAVALANPGTYDLSLHGPNGFFRHFAGSPATALRVEERGDDELGTLALRHRPIADRRRHRAVVVEVADAYGPDRQIRLRRHRTRSRSTPATPAAGTTSR